MCVRIPAPSTSLAVLALACAALVGVVGHLPWTASSSAASPDVAAMGTADGRVPAGTTVYATDVPAVTRLDPALLRALRRAGADAQRYAVTLFVNSGWRSAQYQEALLDEAVAKYGSKEQAARWVATATTSPHVSGDAVDIGRSDAAAWLSDHGATYGLCQIYDNEPWHYELLPAAVDHGCPRRYADPTHDPRMR